MGKSEFRKQNVVFFAERTVASKKPFRGECYAPVSNNRGGSSGGTKQKYCNLVIYDIHSMKQTGVSFAPEKIWMVGMVSCWDSGLFSGANC